MWELTESRIMAVPLTFPQHPLSLILPLPTSPGEDSPSQAHLCAPDPSTRSPLLPMGPPTFLPPIKPIKELSHPVSSFDPSRPNISCRRGYKREVGFLKHVNSLIVLRKGWRQRPIGILSYLVMGSCRVYSPPTLPMSLKCPSPVSRELQSHHLISHSSCFSRFCHLVAIIEASAMCLVFVLSCLPRQYVFFSPCGSCVAAVSLLSLQRKICTAT